jgi:hypothetical protein
MTSVSPGSVMLIITKKTYKKALKTGLGNEGGHALCFFYFGSAQTTQPS